MIDFCAEKLLSVSNTYFENNSLHKNIRVARGQGRVEVMSAIHLVLVKKDMLRYVQDVRAVGEMGRGLSDHHFVLSKLRLVSTWVRRREVVNRAERISSEKLRAHQYMIRYASVLG